MNLAKYLIKKLQRQFSDNIYNIVELQNIVIQYCD